jgi:GTP cyclohydrolase I
VNTPMRAAKAFKYFTSGYSKSLDSVIGNGVFTDSDYSESTVTVKNIEIYSLCEHHMVPFFGKVITK